MLYRLLVVCETVIIVEMIYLHVANRTPKRDDPGCVTDPEPGIQTPPYPAAAVEPAQAWLIWAPVSSMT
jgi:hypothetical protein